MSGQALRSKPYEQSTNISGNDITGPFGNSSGSFASLDTAFNSSMPMNTFQTHMMNHNPLLSQNLISLPCHDPEATPNKKAVTSEEKMNNSIDEVIGAMYVIDAKQSLNNRPGPYQTQLLEGYNGQGMQYVRDTTTTTTSGMSIFKLLLLLILIAALVYGGYWLYQNSKTTTTIKTIQTPTRSVTSVGRNIEKIIRIG